MRHRTRWLLAVSLVLLVIGAGLLYLALRPSLEAHTPPTPALATGQPTASPGVPASPEPVLPPATPTPPPDPFALLSQSTMLATIGALTSIQPYSGWRNSASTGEAEGLDYVGRTLDGFGYLAGLGLEQERQSFEVPLGTELWDTRLDLRLGGTSIQVPASGLRGSRSDSALAVNFDSDGVLNDSERNPVVVEGPVTLLRSAVELDHLLPGVLKGQVVLLDYAVVDPIVSGGMQQAVATASKLLAEAPAGLVLVTRFSDLQGESHGVFAGEGGALSRQEAGTLPPVVLVRLEDLAAAGIEDWYDLKRIQSATLRWDADVFAPAHSGNLIARIPGQDPSRAVILGAHIDSPTTRARWTTAAGRPSCSKSRGCWMQSRSSHPPTCT